MENPVETKINPENITWPEAKKIKLCSSNRCAAGHEWPPTVAVGKCNGCGSPVLVVKMEQCPICNEPVEAMGLRTDHTPTGGAIAALCHGQATLSESSIIEMLRTHATSVEAPKEENAKTSTD